MKGATLFSLDNTLVVSFYSSFYSTVSLVLFLFCRSTFTWCIGETFPLIFSVYLRFGQHFVKNLMIVLRLQYI